MQKQEAANVPNVTNWAKISKNRQIQKKNSMKLDYVGASLSSFVSSLFMYTPLQKVVQTKIALKRAKQTPQIAIQSTNGASFLRKNSLQYAVTAMKIQVAITSAIVPIITTSQTWRENF